MVVVTTSSGVARVVTRRATTRVRATAGVRTAARVRTGVAGVAGVALGRAALLGVTARAGSIAGACNSRTSIKEALLPDRIGFDGLGKAWSGIGYIKLG